MVQVDQIIVLPDPVTWGDGRFSSEMTRRNGRDPDSSLKRLRGFIYVYLCRLQSLRTVTQYPMNFLSRIRGEGTFWLETNKCKQTRDRWPVGCQSSEIVIHSTQ